jgi:hypothetical protein
MTYLRNIIYTLIYSTVNVMNILFYFAFQREAGLLKIGNNVKIILIVGRKCLVSIRVWTESLHKWRGNFVQLNKCHSTRTLLFHFILLFHQSDLFRMYVCTLKTLVYRYNLSIKTNVNNSTHYRSNSGI